MLETYEMLIKNNKDRIKSLSRPKRPKLREELDYFKTLSLLKSELELNNSELIELSRYNCLKGV